MFVLVCCMCVYVGKLLQLEQVCGEVGRVAIKQADVVEIELLYVSLIYCNISKKY